MLFFLKKFQPPIAINHHYLSSTELELFQKIHYETVYNKKRKGRFNRKEIGDQASGRVHKDKSIYNKIDPILKKGINILTRLGITDFDPKYFSMEFHQRNCGFDSKKHELFVWHQDDYGPTNYKVYTVLFYLRKDKTIVGGDLEYKITNSINETINYKHQVKAGDILSFKGDLWHMPEPTSGFGCRDIIVLCIKRLNR